MARVKGRPSLYDPKTHPKLAMQLCLLGATTPQIAEVFEVSHTTIDNWISMYPDFVGALKKGRALADAMAANSLYGRVLAGDVTACIFWLKNRRPDKWRDKHEHRVETNEVRPGPFSPELLRTASEDELKQMQQLVRKFSVQ